MPRGKRTREKEEIHEEKKPEEPVKKEPVREWPVRRDVVYPHHGHGNGVWGVIFIFAGITLLFNTLGLLPWTIWDYIFRFWPVLLILGGIQVLLGEIPGSSLLVAVIAVLLLGSVWIKALSEIHSPFIQQWGLYKLPWYQFLQSLKLK